MISASGFATLDLELLERILRAYDLAYVWAATGWFLDQHHGVFHASSALLELCERRRPRSPQYLERDRRGGTLVRRWNLVLPETVARLGGSGDG